MLPGKNVTHTSGYRSADIRFSSMHVCYAALTRYVVELTTKPSDFHFATCTALLFLVSLLAPKGNAVNNIFESSDFEFAISAVAIGVVANCFRSILG